MCTVTARGDEKEKWSGGEGMEQFGKPCEARFAKETQVRVVNFIGQVCNIDVGQRRRTNEKWASVLDQSLFQ